MSTTTDLSVAATFAASKGEGKIGVVYEMQMGMIDRYAFAVYYQRHHSFTRCTHRGADLSIMSQYPHEKEFLFAPLTGIEVQDTTKKGNVLHISTRLNTNLKVQTIEEMQSKMQNIHLNLVGIVQEDMESKGIMELGVLQKHKDDANKADPLDFNQAEFYLKMTQVLLSIFYYLIVIVFGGNSEST